MAQRRKNPAAKAGRKKGVGNLKRTIDAESGKLGYINQHKVFITDAEKEALESAVRKSKRKQKKLREIFDPLPYKIQGRETGATVGDMRIMGKEADFSIADKSASLQRFRSHDEFERYMKNLDRVNSKDYIGDRARLYKRNYQTALTDPQSGLGLAYDDVSDIIMKIRTMKPDDYIKNVASNEELEIGYLYDDGNGSIQQKLNAIRSALGLNHRELDDFWEGDEYE